LLALRPGFLLHLSGIGPIPGTVRPLQTSPGGWEGTPGDGLLALRPGFLLHLSGIGPIPGTVRPLQRTPRVRSVRALYSNLSENPRRPIVLPQVQGVEVLRLWEAIASQAGSAPLTVLPVLEGGCPHPTEAALPRQHRYGLLYVRHRASRKRCAVWFLRNRGDTPEEDRCPRWRSSAGCLRACAGFPTARRDRERLTELCLGRCWDSPHLPISPTRLHS
jgi:hypothetical protein